MAFKVAPGTLTAVTPPVPSLVKSWPCTATEADPPTRTGSAAYTQVLGMPCVNLGATAGSAGSWTAAAFRGPNAENFTRVRGWVLARGNSQYQWYLGWDSNTTGKLGFSVYLAAILPNRGGVLGAGTGAGPTFPLGPFTDTNHWFYFSMVLDRVGKSFSLALDGFTVATRTDLQPADTDGQNATGLNFTGIAGSVSGLQVDYYN